MTFEDLYCPESNTGCWLWCEYTNKCGYGVYKKSLAHRHSWKIHNGSIPAGMCVLHKCDTPACVNPDHLWLGTHADNMKDMKYKGRSGNHKGEANGRSKLTIAQILEIRNDDRSQCKIAKDYNVHQTLISKIKSNKNWSNDY